MDLCCRTFELLGLYDRLLQSKCAGYLLIPQIALLPAVAFAFSFKVMVQRPN